MDKLLPFAASVASVAASSVAGAVEWISSNAVASIESKLQPPPQMPALSAFRHHVSRKLFSLLRSIAPYPSSKTDQSYSVSIESISPPPPAPLREHLLTVLPDLCGIIPPLADIVYEYLEGVKYPTFTPIPDNYFPSSFDVCDASARGDLLQIQYCLEVLRIDPNLCTSPAKYARSSPICIAAAHGHLLCVQYLLSRGASPYSKDSYYQTALHAAAFNGQEEVALYLLKHHNFLQHAAEGAPKYMTKCTTQSRETALHCAAIGGCIRLLKLLVNEYGLDPDESDAPSRHDSKTALHHAAQRGKLSTVRCLVEELHADPNIRDWYGSSPLDLARLTRRVEPTSADLRGLSQVIEYLEAHGTE